MEHSFFGCFESISAPCLAEVLYADTDPGCSPTLYEGVCDLLTRSGITLLIHGTTNVRNKQKKPRVLWTLAFGTRRVLTNFQGSENNLMFFKFCCRNKN